MAWSPGARAATPAATPAPATAPTAAVSPLPPASRIAFFGLTLVDTSLGGAELGADPAEAARIELLEAQIREAFEAQGHELVDLAPVAVEIDRVVNPAHCNGCDTDMATKLGAAFSLVGEVQKVSELILSMNLQLRDAGTGRTVLARVVDIRSNTDASWTRGMRYILRYTFFPEK